MRRREAEGLIYTGKCQGTKQWPILPHYNRTHYNRTHYNISYKVLIYNYYYSYSLEER